jgi:hypothetical protein
MSFARRAAQIGRFARIALKYIATHELAGNKHDFEWTPHIH